MGALTIMGDAWKHRNRLGDANREREMAAFLPAALEIQVAPPHPLTRWVARSLLLLTLIAIIWAALGQVNVVASAEGKILPGSRVKDIQPFERAVISRILVREGQMVDKGQALVELDRTATKADEAAIAAELKGAHLQRAVSEALVELTGLPEKEQARVSFDRLDLKSVQQANEIELALHKNLLWNQWRQYRGQKQGLASALDKNRAEQSMAETVVSKLEQTLPIISKRARNMRALVSDNFASETDYLELEQERIRQAQDLIAERHRLDQLKAARAEIQQQINALDAQTRARQLNAISEHERRITTLSEELHKAADLNRKRVLYAPVAGQVKELAITTEGGVVTEAQKLMQIVPEEDTLEVRVMLENKDIGFVHEGMPAEIKVHTFPFTKYGVIEGEIVSISNDATIDEQRGLLFGMQVRMNKSEIDVNGQPVDLMPGMTVTAEVQTGRRRVIEFFMEPLLRYRDESIQER